jgi:hypothetical protein
MKKEKFHQFLNNNSYLFQEATENILHIEILLKNDQILSIKRERRNVRHEILNAMLLII